jgi:hypothetical protein
MFQYQCRTRTFVQCDTRTGLLLQCMKSALVVSAVAVSAMPPMPKFPWISSHPLLVCTPPISPYWLVNSLLLITIVIHVGILMASVIYSYSNPVGEISGYKYLRGKWDAIIENLYQHLALKMTKMVFAYRVDLAVT